MGGGGGGEGIDAVHGLIDLLSNSQPERQVCILWFGKMIIAFISSLIPK